MHAHTQFYPESPGERFAFDRRLRIDGQVYELCRAPCISCKYNKVSCY